MPRALFEDVIRYLRHAAALGADCDLTDAQLLDRFLTQREESAFTFLVQRHGPMILGAGRRVLGDAHEAEDVLQATFLILARRTRALGGKRSLGGWLHGVAHHVALKAKATLAARRKRERETRTMPAARPVDELTCQELRAALDEAIASLPEKYHAPVVLCDLEGQSYDQAAQELGCPKTTLARRLSQARELLRKKLVHRGIGLTAAALATTVADIATASPMPAMLTIKTVKAAGLVVAGKSVAGCLSAGAIALAEEAMIVAKGKMVLMVMVVGLAVGGVGWAGYSSFGEKDQQVAAQPEAPVAKQAAKPVKKAAPRMDRYGDDLPEFAVSRFGTVRFNHGHRLHSVFFLPDGKTLLSEGSGYVRLWDASNGKELGQFATSDTWAEQGALSPDGKFFSLLSQENPNDTVRTWELTTGKEVRVLTLPVRHRGNDIWHQDAISPDGSLSAVTMPTEILVFDNRDGKKLFTLPNFKSDQGLAVVFAGNDKLVTADKKQQLRVWDARTGKKLREFTNSTPADVLAASPDGSLLATLGHQTYAIDRLKDKNLVHVWNVNTGKHLHALPAPPKGWYVDVRFSPDGKMLFGSCFGEEDAAAVAVWDPVAGSKIREFTEGYVRAISPDGRWVALGWQKFNLIDLQTGDAKAYTEFRHASASDVFFAPAGDRALTVNPTSVNEWSVATGRLLRSTKLPYFGPADPRPTHSPDGRYAITFEGTYKKLQIVIWDVVANKPLRTFKPTGANQSMKTAFSPDSRLLATDQLGDVRIWEIATGKEIRSFKDTKSGWFGTPYFTGSGKTMTIAGRDVLGFDIGTGQQLHSWRRKPAVNGPMIMVTTKNGKPVPQPDPSAWRSIAVSPDGKITAGILTGGHSIHWRVANRIVLSDAKTGAVLRTMDDSGVATPEYELICFSSDSRLLATSDGDIVHLWETATGKEIVALRGHRGDIMSLAFGSENRRLASSSQDSTCLIWDLALAVGVAEPLPLVPGEKEIASWWTELAGADPRQAYAALWRLAECPKTSVPFLSQQLRPISEADVKQIARDIADLGSEEFAKRKAAFEQLTRLGCAAEEALRDAIKTNPPLETQRRLEQLLSKLKDGPMTGEPLRTLRALAVLEMAGTAEARNVIENLARGAKGAWRTEEAKTSLERLAVCNLQLTP